MDVMTIAPPTRTGSDAEAAASRRIAGEGTPECGWQGWPGLAALQPRTLAEIVPKGRRVVVVAPHPDDELLGCGGTLARLAQAGHEIAVVGVTDGEASHPQSSRFTPRSLAATRCSERKRGLRALGLAGSSQRLVFPDGGVTANEQGLMHALVALLEPGDVVFTTWRLDGHPDHEAVGRATASATRARDATLVEMPVWMWHWARPDDPRVPWERLVRVALDAGDRNRKSRAIAEHASQLDPDGDRPAILPDWALARLQRPFEYFFVEAPRVMHE